MRRCDGCGTPLRGKHRHGFVVGRLVLCGRRETEATRGEKLVKIALRCGRTEV